MKIYMIKITNKIIKKAKMIALKSNQKKSKMSALLLSKNKIIGAQNYNCIGGIKWSIHAEEHLIIKAAKLGISLKRSTVLIYRINGSGESKPCPKCRDLLIKAGVKNIIYYDGKQFIFEKI
jgi:deoxycytidylate deaminase